MIGYDVGNQPKEKPMGYIVVLNDKETYTDLLGCFIYEVLDEEAFAELSDDEISEAIEQGIIRCVEPVNMTTR